jgi:glycosyltransferase involved in cell wall biosynthesis
VNRPVVAHLTTVHGRRDVRIFEKQARSLAAAGFDVHLVVGDGQGGAQVDGVVVHDIGTVGPSRARRMLLQGWRMWRAARRLRARLYHFHDPELLWVGLLLRAGGAAVVYDSHEDVPRDILSKTWIAPPIRRTVAWCAERIEDFVAARLSAVVAATPHIAARFRRVQPRALDINNYPAEADLGAPLDAPRDPRRLCYVGGIGAIRGVHQMLQALEAVDATLLLAGAFESPETEASARAQPGWAKVEYLGTVSREEVRRIMAGSSAGLLLFHPEPNHVDAQPNKMFEYMSAGLPVVASDFPLWRRVLVDQGAGVCVDPLEPARIAAVIQALLDDPSTARRMGAAGRAAVHAHYRWEVEAAKLIALYRALLAA